MKCSPDIVAKVITGNKDYTEYTTLQYLAEHVSDIPAPRPHGLIAFGPFRVIFMTCMPGVTLAEAWPGMSQEAKASVQQQLDGMFRRLRTIRQSDGKPLGGVAGEGAKEYRVDEMARWQDITTAKEYSDLQFTARHRGSATYVALLRAFIADSGSAATVHGSVFTHGDVRRENIMVQRDPGSDDGYVVTGLIDWEDAGFYPTYYESTMVTVNLSVWDENDWFLYIPECISPLSFPVRWLVDRLWSIHVRST